MWLNRAFDNLSNDPFCGIQIPKKQIPKIYIKKYGIDNLWVKWEYLKKIHFLEEISLPYSLNNYKFNLQS